MTEPSVKHKIEIRREGRGKQRRFYATCTCHPQLIGSGATRTEAVANLDMTIDKTNRKA